MEVNLNDLSNETLYGLIKVSVDILKERSEIPGKIAQIKPMPVEKTIKEKKHKRGPYKKSIAKGVVATTTKSTKFTELDKIIKKHYGKKGSKEMIKFAAEKGITTDAKQIDYRRRMLGIKANAKAGKPKKTDDEYLKSIEERDKLDLKGTENSKIMDEPEGDD